YLHAAAYRPQDLDQDEVLAAWRAEVGIAGVVAEVGRVQLDHPLETVGLGDPGCDQGGVYGVEHAGLEGVRLRLADGDGNEGHRRSPVRVPGRRIRRPRLREVQSRPRAMNTLKSVAT